MVTRATLEARIAAREAQLVIAEETYTKLLSQLLTTYSFESAAQGTQGATRQKLSEIKKQIDILISDIDLLNRQLDGGGVARMHSTRWG